MKIISRAGTFVYGGSIEGYAYHIGTLQKKAEYTKIPRPHY